MENLVKLSFDQERLMKDFRNIRIGDPRFIKLGQTQLKLKDKGEGRWARWGPLRVRVCV